MRHRAVRASHGRIVVRVPQVKHSCHMNSQNNIRKITIQEGVKREGSKRGRKPGRKSKSDMKAKLERSRQSARECRARKKLRYQYLEELVANREKAVFSPI
ncbi:unnamed protein product [Meganyctiphanes norvegica]|uniref:BZIP domain-containing protein n=1 Tax=Meganyctiphanes norvegica TaxID=48144 RepID=A0AAV2PW56_MEGNR